MTTGSPSESCINWPCAKGAGHSGPCGTSPDERSSNELVSNDKLTSAIAWFEAEPAPNSVRVNRDDMARLLRELQDRRDADQLRAAHELCEKVDRLQHWLGRALRLVERWEAKYGEHQPDWLPPAGSVRLREEIDEEMQRWRTAPEPPDVLTQCPFCGRPSDEGAINHEPYCEGLQDAGLCKLQLYMLERRASQPPSAGMDPYERAVRLAEEWQKTDETRKFLVAVIELAEEIGGFDHETRWSPALTKGEAP